MRLVWVTLFSMSIPRSPDPEPRASWRWAGVRLVCGTLVSMSIPRSPDPEPKRPRGAGQGCACSVVHWFLRVSHGPRTLSRGGLVALGRGAPALWYTGFYEYPMVPGP
ncbi:hypothetical protein NDU88_009033 [Pleurodeles waltl]|uniref:Secreted protein n=1 Tax=Pleurodeles waltl TaxID=8319 RepID=A0AAV7N6P0_PLEWA|nr:hypothetical protein NDU88_009033 [Pleurodeles waltl]